jgi:DNA repair exonuclease SbcCD ATPase subunit
MKIINLKAENIKKLVAVEITPSGEIVTIAGRNGQGKTSVLDSIWWALAGTSHIQAQPIRSGQNKARIRLDLGEIIVERKFTDAGSTLTVTSADGARISSPQKMLDALLGELSFDPLAFSRMAPKLQFDELRRVSKLEIDVDAIERANKADYDARTTVNRDAKARRAQLEGIVVPTVPAGEPFDEQALLQQMEQAATANADIETRKARRTAAQQDAARLRQQATEATAKAAELRQQAQTLIEQAANQDTFAARDNGDAEALEARLAAAPALPEPTDVAALRQQIDAARTAAAARNARTQALEQRKLIEADAEALETRSQTLTDAMTIREKQKADAIAAAQMPVEGLGFGDGIVTFRGVPFDQCSSAEQLRVSLGIAMAANPKVRVIRIQDGSLLDEDSLRAVAEMAKGNDYQVWIEKVDTSGTVGIVIEDGHVKTVNAEPAELVTA